ncbi:MAG: NAD(P)/FAD-dependent oxidoreductase, partial [Methanosarcinaceae archaeon]|nr:NAD(P)/FAD-dependent oxidoreductase [Methanosarcinaceae archaeon]
MRKDYDVVIIGSGVSGLVCGCFLAQSNKKVLIVEQSDKPGGFCTSFTRKGLKFDIGPHYIGGIRWGVFGKILKELEVYDSLAFVQLDPADRIYFKNDEILIRKEAKETLAELIKYFPKQLFGLNKFFGLLLSNNVSKIFSLTKRLSFLKFMKSYFDDCILFDFFNRLLWGIIGVPISALPAWVGVEILRDFLLDPGYYPMGGLERIGEVFVDKFKALGGQIEFNSQVVRILYHHSALSGLILLGGREISCKCVVASIDPFQLSKLIGEQKEIFANLGDFKPSLSAMVVFLGYDRPLSEIFKGGACVWLMKDRKHNDSFFRNQYLIYSPSSRDEILSNSHSENHTIQIFSFFNFPKTNVLDSDHHLEKAFSTACTFMPELGRNVSFKEFASPSTFQRVAL